MTNGELSKTPSYVWQKLKWSHKEGNLDKCQISAEMARMPKRYQGFGQIFKWDDKRGILTTNCGLYDNDKIGKSLQKVWQKWNQCEKTSTSILVNLTKMINCEIGQFGKDSSKVWQKKNSEAIKETYWQLAISTKMTNLGKWQMENWARLHHTFGKS